MKSIIFEGKILKVGMIQFLSKFSKKAYHLGISPVRYVEIKKDKLPGKNYLKVENIQTGICGTDMTFYTCKQGPSTAFLPMPGSDVTYLGHETVGIVKEKGSGVSKFEVGDRVTMLKYLSCCAIKDIQDPCRNCKEGNYAICENYGEKSRVKGFLGAGFGDYYYANEDQLLKIPDEISDDEATLIEPFSVSLHAVLKRVPKDHEKVLVVGAGMIGLGVIQFIKVLNPNCEVYVMEKNKNKHEFAKKLGADAILIGDSYQAVANATGAKLYGKHKNRMLMGGFDVIYDTVGKGNLFNDTLRWLRGQGTLVKVGYQMTKTKFDETPIWWQGLNIIGVDAHGMEEYKGVKKYTFEMVMDMLKEHKLITKGFITHKFPLDNYKDAFKLLIENPTDAVKVVLTCNNKEESLTTMEEKESLDNEIISENESVEDKKESLENEKSIQELLDEQMEELTKKDNE